MYMFRRKRTNLAKRLWKARIIGKTKNNETVCEAKNMILEDDSNENSCYCCAKTLDKVPFYESLLRHTLIKRLKDTELEVLVEAIESNGSNMSPCILLPSHLLPNAHFLCCQLWRWPDVSEPYELKKLPNCDSHECSKLSPSSSGMYICCNPYHWSRRCKSDSPPPPYRRFSNERLKPEDKAPSESELICDHISRQIELRGSLTTNGEGDRRPGEWCKLAYWELSQRVGRLYPVDTPYINVFWAQPCGDGLCLETLANSGAIPNTMPSCGKHQLNPHHVPDAVRRTRTKIGLGLTLSLESDGVWAYNRSEAPVFVNSPGLDDRLSPTLLVYRIPPGHCLKIFDPGLPPRLREASTRPTPPTGPIDPNSIRISFAKGWGPKYSRQEITSCPAWLEVLLVPHPVCC